MDMYNGLNPNTGTFTPASDTSYKERVSYDPNGNILGYLRNGDAGNTMDSLNYKYYVNTNQLSQVTDNVPATKYTTDIDNQNANNYTYDAIGNMISDAGDTITNVTWNVYGKIMSVTKNGRLIKYVYDAAGNRIMKYTNADTTAYVRDASGNVMSVYSKPANSSSIVQTEMDLYGSSRLGMATQHLAPDTSIILIGGFGNMKGSIFTRGEKFFELSNHLGNVLLTVTDRRIQVDGNSDGTVDSYKADIASANDYYPFGVLMPGRQYSIANTNYRYGFNGKEKDNSISSLTDYDYGFRIYNPGIGRFLSMDPLTQKYSELTPYQYASNSPISGVDEDGLEWAYYDKDNKQININTNTTNYDKLKIAGVRWAGYDVDSKGNKIPKPGTVSTAYTFGLKGLTTSSIDANGNATRRFDSYSSLGVGSSSSQKKINTLYGSVQDQMISFILIAKYRFDIDLRVSDGFRTIEEQDLIFAKGRTQEQVDKEKKRRGIDRTIVAKPDDYRRTNAIGGYSNHNFGLAIDVVPFENGRLNWNSKNYPLIGLIGESRALEWGHRFKTIDDPPHFQNLQGKTLSQLRALPKDEKGLPIIK